MIIKNSNENDSMCICFMPIAIIMIKDEDYGDGEETSDVGCGDVVAVIRCWLLW